VCYRPAQTARSDAVRVFGTAVARPGWRAVALANVILDLVGEVGD
jgi:hypothetical protein